MQKGEGSNQNVDWWPTRMGVGRRGLGGAGRPTLGVIDPDGTCLREGRAPRNCVWGRRMKPLSGTEPAGETGEIIIKSDFQSVRKSKMKLYREVS